MAKEKIKNNTGENNNKTSNSQEAQSSKSPMEAATFLKGFVLMPFGKDDEIETLEESTPSNEKQTNEIGVETQVLMKAHQDDLFWILIFAINDAFYRNFLNKKVRTYKPINLERADTGAGLSADLLDNIFLKINESDFCLADFTTLNPNVSLEVGYSIARDKYIVQIVQGDMMGKDRTKTIKKLSDLSSKLVYSIESKELFRKKIWKDKISKAENFNEIVEKSPDFFLDIKAKINPFADTTEEKYRTFLGAWIKERAKEKGNNELMEINDDDLKEVENLYETKIVRPLYHTIRPLWKKIYSGSTEVQYTCDVFASREAAEFDSVFSDAKKSIKILTTNLEGLVKYIPDIRCAANENNAIVNILTLDPESEFVNARGTLIGKEIWEFRKEMKDSLKKFREGLLDTRQSDEQGKCQGESDGNSNKSNGTIDKPKDKPKIFIRIYREFPTQITYIVDDHIYSNVVSVNHQSRNNIVFKIREDRKGVENSFLQHWDTIWARAHDVQAIVSF